MLSKRLPICAFSSQPTRTPDSNNNIHHKATAYPAPEMPQQLPRSSPLPPSTFCQTKWVYSSLTPVRQQGTVLRWNFRQNQTNDSQLPFSSHPRIKSDVSGVNSKHVPTVF